MLTPERSSYPNGHCNCDTHGNCNCNGYSDSNAKPDRDCDEDYHSDADCNLDVMALPVPTAGPRFADLMARPGQDPGTPSPDGGAGAPPTAALQANMTNPIHQAEAAAKLSKKRLQDMAKQIQAARDVI